MKKIKGAKIGQVFSTVIDRKKYSKKVSKEEYVIIAKQIELYNKTNSERSMKALVRLLTPIAEKAKTEKAKVETVLKAKKKLVKKAIKKDKPGKVSSSKANLVKELQAALAESNATVESLKALIEASKKVETPVPTASAYKRSGEY